MFVSNLDLCSLLAYIASIVLFTAGYQIESTAICSSGTRKWSKNYWSKNFLRSVHCFLSSLNLSLKWTCLLFSVYLGRSMVDRCVLVFVHTVHELLYSVRIWLAIFVSKRKCQETKVACIPQNHWRVDLFLEHKVLKNWWNTCIIFYFRILPVAHKADKESDEDFACRVQQMIASSLGVAVTPHSSADKVEYAKRKLIESSLPSAAPAGKWQFTATHQTNNQFTTLPVCLFKRVAWAKLSASRLSAITMVCVCMCV